ncbi:ferredoxin-dependent glutamate synthase, partial [Staphylococcus aureus]|nr:ferredoxin-dependent glutamate synthase [Staphylococcus aureus]MVL46481.1 ferredoxin-dependent glutamate synthase [Staphylococcus aureus]
MTFLTVMQFIVNIIVVGFMLTVIVIGLIWLIKDKRQSQHSVLRN